jgi:hypothetical protein
MLDPVGTSRKPTVCSLTQYNLSSILQPFPHMRFFHTATKRDPDKYVTSFILRCACGRAYKHQSSGKRSRTSSRMTGCTWRAWRKAAEDEETGEFGWSFDIEVPYHNHNRAVGKAAFTQHRKRDEYLLSCVKAMYE